MPISPISPYNNRTIPTVSPTVIPPFFDQEDNTEMEQIYTQTGTFPADLPQDPGPNDGGWGINPENNGVGGPGEPPIIWIDPPPPQLPTPTFNAPRPTWSGRPGPLPGRPGQTPGKGGQSKPGGASGGGQGGPSGFLPLPPRH